MDIDDILAGVDRRANLYVADDLPQGTQDLQDLTRAWVAERTSPEIMQYPEALIQRSLKRIRKQIEAIEAESSSTDPRVGFRLIIMDTELERFKFLIRSFLRARMAKLDKYPIFYQRDPEMRARLSSSELQWLNLHQQTLQSHLNACFMNDLPAPLRRFDDTAGGISMVDQPDLDTAVFCRVLRDVEEPINMPSSVTSFDLRRGDVHVVRYSAVRRAIERGDVELM
ncbi:MAG: hypothetical protein M1825_001704 [Sarcosagium campestre]|nr:MAG: hypothetical protein M1825_001704 [Sarcosagium campestre]